MKTLTSFWQSWEKFWFGPQDLVLMSVFRLLVGVTLLAMYSVRILEIELFFFEQGLMSLAEARDFYPAFYEPLIWLQPPSDTAVVLVYSALLVALLALAIGFGGRVTAMIVLLLHLSLFQRNSSITYGADTYACFWLLFLAMAKNNAHLNLVNWLRRGRPRWSTEVEKVADPFSSMALRFVQIQLCVSYAYTGMEKLRGPMWWDGSAIWGVLGNAQISQYDLSFMYHFPLLVAFLTFATLIFEIYFPIAVWVRSLRVPWLLMGVVLHLGIALVMGLHFFAFLMLAAYVTFLEPATVRRTAAASIRAASPGEWSPLGWPSDRRH